jgi:hypothetical protein
VALSEALMVGDTPADTIMGQLANLGLTIGVLTGVGDHADLIDADLIVQVRLRLRLSPLPPPGCERRGGADRPGDAAEGRVGPPVGGGDPQVRAAAWGGTACPGASAR